MSVGDVLSQPGRFGPLTLDHPGVGKLCPLCSQPLVVGDSPALIESELTDPDEVAARDRGGAYNAECDLAHESCAFPSMAGQQVKHEPERVSTDAVMACGGCQEFFSHRHLCRFGTPGTTLGVRYLCGQCCPCCSDPRHDGPLDRRP